ncbi:glycosyltransferase family 87 protein [Nesterenkonia flava]|uniref:DUF2029 domain-containing protein n=1 Tax=Nesterenkonia flava TaxID=469799 RepID=A0ABU1FUC5_9MICC|nr:hypothetical protein [Nesterenkonia flava]MDR5711783.1 hypothetical protein [Nesterenkonia flava]
MPRILVALTLGAILLSALSSQWCRINGWGQPGVYHYGCYSDVTALWTLRGFHEFPHAPFVPAEEFTQTAEPGFEYPILTSLVAVALAWVTHKLSLPGGEGAPTAAYWAGRDSLLLWDITFLVSALLWIALVLITMKSAGRRPWDAVIVAVSPAIIFGIGINWDIWPAVALAGAVLAYQRGRLVWAGVLVGVGVSFKVYPLFLLGAVLVLMLRGLWKRDTDVSPLHFVRLLAATALTWLVINGPAMLLNFEAWRLFYDFSAERGAGNSSLWHLWILLGDTFGPVDSLWTWGSELFAPAPGEDGGAEMISFLSLTLFALSCAGVLILGLLAKNPPRMVQLLLLIVAAFMIFNKVYSPQFMLWLVPLIALAAPRIRDVIIWHAVQVLHFWAIWMHLAQRGDNYMDRHSMDPDLMAIAIVAVHLSTAYIAAQVVWDILRPERDVVRTSP